MPAYSVFMCHTRRQYSDQAMKCRTREMGVVPARRAKRPDLLWRTHNILTNKYVKFVPVCKIFGGVTVTHTRARAHAQTRAHTHTHTQYVILIAFALQHWLHERTSMLRYTHTDCLVHCSFFFVYRHLIYLRFLMNPVSPNPPMVCRGHGMNTVQNATVCVYCAVRIESLNKIVVNH